MATVPQKKTPGFMDFLFTTAKAVTKATGNIWPLDKELGHLEASDKMLRTMMARVDSIVSKEASPLQHRNTADATTLYSNLKREAAASKDIATVARKAIGAAIAEGRKAQESLRYGTAAAKPTAQFFIKKSYADERAATAKVAMERIISHWESVRLQLFREAPLISEVPKVLYRTGVEFGRKVGTGIVKTGEVVTEAGKGAADLAPYAKYLPHIALGVGALYLWSLLPKRRS